MFGVDLQPAIAGVDDVYFKAGFDLAQLLGKLCRRGEDPGAASDFVSARGCRRLYFGLSCRLRCRCLIGLANRSS